MSDSGFSSALRPAKLVRVLTIAGSDSSGGAGIQADIKTITSLGGYAASAITALTAQNTLGVHEVLPLPPDFVAHQIQVILDDIGADAIKIGMLGSRGVIESVARVLDGCQIPIILDPVLGAKGGARLLPEDAHTALVSLLVPRAILLTPNMPEAAALTGMPCVSLDDMKRIASSLCAQMTTTDIRGGAVLLKGGHGNASMITNVLATSGETEYEFEIFETPRLSTYHTHGTGCTLSAAITTLFAQGVELRTACAQAIAYVFEAIATAPEFGQGHGPLNHHLTGH